MEDPNMIVQITCFKEYYRGFRRVLFREGITTMEFFNIFIHLIAKDNTFSKDIIKIIKEERNKIMIYKKDVSKMRVTTSKQGVNRLYELAEAIETARKDKRKNDKENAK